MTSRRRLLSLVVKLPLVSGLMFLLRGPVSAAAASGPPLSPAQLRALQHVGFLLLPFPAVGAAPYERFAATLADRSANDAELGALLSGGLKQLDARVGGTGFLDAAEPDQLAALENIQHGEFFQWLLAFARNQLLDDEAVWAHIGYEGSSLEFGGYRNRGLNDIDWL